MEPLNYEPAPGNDEPPGFSRFRYAINVGGLYTLMSTLGAVGGLMLADTFGLPFLKTYLDAANAAFLTCCICPLPLWISCSAGMLITQAVFRFEPEPRDAGRLLVIGFAAIEGTLFMLLSNQLPSGWLLAALLSHWGFFRRYAAWWWFSSTHEGEATRLLTKALARAIRIATIRRPTAVLPAGDPVPVAQADIIIADDRLLPQAVELYNSVFRPRRETDFFKRRFMGRYNALTLIARIEERPVGFWIGFELKPGMFYHWLGAVVPDLRRQGIGRQLHEAQQAWAKDHGYEYIRCEAMNHQREFIHFALELGYDIAGVRWDSTHADNMVVLEKNLME